MTDQPTLEAQLARIVALGWFPSLRMVGTQWVAAAGKTGSGAYLCATKPTHDEAMTQLIAKVEGWGK
jgi:hypothetical protein